MRPRTPTVLTAGAAAPAHAFGAASVITERTYGPALRIGFRRLLRAEHGPLIPHEFALAPRFLIWAAGRQAVEVRSATRWSARRLRPGDGLLLQAGEQCESRSGYVGPSTYWWIAFNQDPGIPLLGMAEQNGLRFRRMLDQLERRRFSCSPHLEASLAALFDVPPPNDDLLELACESAVQSILVQLLRDATGPVPTPLTPELRFAMRCAVEMLNKGLDDPPTWATIARHAQLPAARLWQLFKQTAGHSPTEYVNARRIDRAIRLLRAGKLTNTQVAHAVGFSTSQYFAVVFRRLKGVTPTEFIEGMSGCD